MVTTTPTPTPTPIITPEAKRLAFALLSLSNPTNVSQVSTLLDNPSIDGVAVQIGWTSMETADEVFNWTTLDATLKTAKDRGKGVTLHVFAGAGGSQAFSPWLKAAGVKTYTLTDPMGRTHEEGVPWDQTLLSQYSAFIKSLAVHLASTGYTSTVARMSIAVPVAEMDMIACKNNMLANTYPYDRATYLASWKTMIDAYNTSFPSLKKLVSAPVGLICFPERDTQFFVDVMDYAFKNYGATFSPFAADLTSIGSDRMKSYTDMVPTKGLGYQTIWSSTNDRNNRMIGTYPGTLLSAMCKAVSDNADYVEVYAVDVTNTDATIQKGIQALHDSTLCK